MVAKQLQLHLFPPLGKLQAEMEGFQSAGGCRRRVEVLPFITLTCSVSGKKGKKSCQVPDPWAAGSNGCPAAHEKSPKHSREILWQVLGS